MKKILFILCLSLLSNVHAQLEFVYANNFSVPLDNMLASIDPVIAPSGNQYILYTVQNTTKDLVVVKRNACGQYQWDKTYDSGNDDVAVKIAIDASENVYIVGNWISGMERPLLVKYSSTGSLLNSNEYFLTAGAKINDMIMEGTDIFLVGTHATGSQGNNGWLGKFNSTLAHQWSRSYDPGTNGNNGFDQVKKYGTNLYIDGGRLVSYTMGTGAFNWDINNTNEDFAVDATGVYLFYNSDPYIRIRKYTLGGIYVSTDQLTIDRDFNVFNMKFLNGNLYTIGQRETPGGWQYAAIWKLGVDDGIDWFKEYDNPNSTNEAIDTYYFDAHLADNGDLVVGGYIKLATSSTSPDRELTLIRYDVQNGNQLEIIDQGGYTDNGLAAYSFLKGNKDDYYIYQQDGSPNNGLFKRFAYRPIDFYSLSGTATHYYCEGSSQTLSINIPAGYSFEWNGAVNYSNINSPTTEATASNGVSGIATIYLDECMSKIDIPLVEENVVPDGVYFNDIYQTTDQTITICAGDSVKIQGVANNNYDYSYNSSDYSYSLLGDEIRYIKEAGVFNGYALELSTNSLCGTNLPQLTIEILSPAVDLGPNIEICQGESVMLDAGEGMDSYAWSNGDLTQTTTVSTTNTYDVEVSLDGCSAIGSVQVTVNNLPTIIANATNEELCIGESTTLTGSGGVSYEWDNNITNGVPFSPTSTDFYTVTGTDANGCENTDVITINVNPIDEATVSYNVVYYTSESDPSPVVTGASGTFSESTGNIIFVDASTGQIDLSASTVGGPYEIIYTTSGNCPITVSSFVTIESSAGIDEYTLNSFTVYPNPFNQFVNIESNSTIKVVSVFNTTGQLIYRDTTKQINTTNWESGTYLLEIEFEDETIRKPIVKI